MAVRNVKIKKWNGNDAYSWAVFVDGKLVQGLTGLNRAQALHYRDQIRNAEKKTA